MHVCGLENSNVVLLQIIVFVTAKLITIRLCRLSSVHGLSLVYNYIQLPLLSLNDS